MKKNLLCASEVGFFIGFAIASWAVRELLIKFSKHTAAANNNQQAIELAPLNGKSLGKLLKILGGDDELAIQEVVRQNHVQLRPVVKMICLAAFEKEDLAERRRINKLFFKCVVAVESSKALALIWLKKHLDRL